MNNRDLVALMAAILRTRKNAPVFDREIVEEARQLLTEVDRTEKEKAP